MTEETRWCSCTPLREAKEKAAKWDTLVRCKDCEHSLEDGYLCRMFGITDLDENLEVVEIPALVNPDGFCHMGERGKR